MRRGGFGGGHATVSGEGLGLRRETDGSREWETMVERPVVVGQLIFFARALSGASRSRARSIRRTR